MTKKTVDFEATLAELASIVEQMEQGDATLDESLKAFEKGVRLTRECQAALQAAELRVKKLTQDGELAPLEPETDDD